MPRNGAGEYSLPAGYAATDENLATAAQHNEPLEDIAAALNGTLPVVKGGTGATTASGARTALGLIIGENVQAYSANLASLSGLTFAANKGLYTTGANTAALFDLTAAGRALLDDADAAAQRATLGLGNIATTNLIDEDDMASDSAARAPSQQSVKAYVDGEITALPITVEFLSSAQAITSGGELTIAHGLGAVPKIVSPFIRCVTPELGFSADDDVPIDFNSSYGSVVSTGANITTTTTNLVVRFGSNSGAISILRKDTGALGVITNANWRFFVRAFA